MREEIKKKERKKMCRNHLHKTCTVALNLIPILFLTFLTHPTTSHTFIYGGCSQEKYQPGSPFQTNLNSLLSSLVASSADSSYNSFAVGNGTSPVDPAYGLYQCRGDLEITDCANCLQNAIQQLSLVCAYAYTAGLQLEGCFVRYENANFFGKLDTTLAYKKCSSSSSNDGEFFNRRDDVLADLQSAVGFKVSSSGLVEGFAQCLGDLNSADCSSCLAEAVGKLKNVCGSALWGDVYLAQCFVRYWASGYYPHSSPDSSNVDAVGRTVSIIIGVLAGVALIIVLLSFLRKAF